MVTLSQPLAAEVDRRVRQALASAGPDAGNRVGITVCGDKVVLHGSVKCWRDHELAGRAAASTPGVARVDNALALFIRATVARTT